MNSPAASTAAAAPPKIRALRSFDCGCAAASFSSSRSSSVLGLTFVAFSKPTSISILIPGVLFKKLSYSLRVNFFHLPDSARIVRTRLVEPVQRNNLVVVRPRQRVLRLNHFNVVRHAGFEAVARLVHFFLRQLYAQIRHLYFVARRFQIEQRCL